MNALAPVALAAALQDALPPDDGTKTLVFGILAITAIAGLLDTWQVRFKDGGWPVPLIVYATLLPIVTFIVVLSGIKDAGLGFEWLALPLAPLPLLVAARLSQRCAQPA